VTQCMTCHIDSLVWLINMPTTACLQIASVLNVGRRGPKGLHVRVIRDRPTLFAK
jgi:hypothetical protein